MDQHHQGDYLHNRRHTAICVLPQHLQLHLQETKTTNAQTDVFDSDLYHRHGYLWSLLDLKKAGFLRLRISLGTMGCEVAKHRPSSTSSKYLNNALQVAQPSTLFFF